jgi:Flp pilus assembly pilin Flp
VNRLPTSHPALDYLLLQLQVRHARATAEGTDRGASAVEWVVISAIVVGIVAAVAVIIRTAINNKANDVRDCIQSANGQAGC